MDMNGVLFLILVASVSVLFLTAFGIRFKMPQSESKEKVVSIKGEPYMCKPVGFKKAA